MFYVWRHIKDIICIQTSQIISPDISTCIYVLKIYLFERYNKRERERGREIFYLPPDDSYPEWPQWPRQDQIQEPGAPSSPVLWVTGQALEQPSGLFSEGTIHPGIIGKLKL